MTSGEFDPNSDSIQHTGASTVPASLGLSLFMSFLRQFRCVKGGRTNENYTSPSADGA